MSRESLVAALEEENPKLGAMCATRIRASETGCLEWTGTVANGYGTIKHGGRNHRAHRLIYSLVVGPIPEGLVIDHLCRNKRCVNPAHLEAVTVRENTLRGVGPTAQNMAKTHCLRGHPFSDANTRWDGRGRVCRECHRVSFNLGRTRRDPEMWSKKLAADRARRRARTLGVSNGTR